MKKATVLSLVTAFLVATAFPHGVMALVSTLTTSDARAEDVTQTTATLVWETNDKFASCTATYYAVSADTEWVSSAPSTASTTPASLFSGTIINDMYSYETALSSLEPGTKYLFDIRCTAPAKWAENIGNSFTTLADATEEEVVAEEEAVEEETSESVPVGTSTNSGNIGNGLLDINMDEVALTENQVDPGFSIDSYNDAYESFDAGSSNHRIQAPKQYYIQLVKSDSYGSDRQHMTGELRLYKDVGHAQQLLSSQKTNHTRKVISLTSGQQFGDDIFCHASGTYETAIFKDSFKSFTEINRREGFEDIYYFICGFRQKNATVTIQATITDNDHQSTLDNLRKYYDNLAAIAPGTSSTTPSSASVRPVTPVRESVSKAVPVKVVAGDAILDNIQNAKNLITDNKYDQLLKEMKELKDKVREQEAEIKYLRNIKKDVAALSDKIETFISNFVTYGVDENTKKLGAGERAAVLESYKEAFDKLPESDTEIEDAVKIANGRWPGLRSEEAEAKAKENFREVYKRDPKDDNEKDTNALMVMGYGLRQRAENRNLESEKAGINIYKGIFGEVPKSTEDWNTLQAITYSGATR